MNKNKLAAFSIIELLLTLFLGSLLFLELSQIYLHIKSNLRLQRAMIQIQEDGRFIVNTLDRRIRMAGYARCSSKTDINQAQAIIGYTTKNIQDHFKIEPISGSDIIVIGECIHYQSKIQFIKKVYFVGDTHRKNVRGQSITALFQQVVSGKRQELIEGVDKMKILYGVMSNDRKNIIKYLTAAQVNDWKKVGSVEIALVLNSIYPVFNKPRVYWFMGEDIVPFDHLLHKTWITYINLRERH